MMPPPSAGCGWFLAFALTLCLMVMGHAIRRLTGKRAGTLDYVLPLFLAALTGFMAAAEIVLWLAREGPR